MLPSAHTSGNIAVNLICKYMPHIRLLETLGIAVAPRGRVVYHDRFKGSTQSGRGLRRSSRGRYAVRSEGGEVGDDGGEPVRRQDGVGVERERRQRCLQQQQGRASSRHDGRLDGRGALCWVAQRAVLSASPVT